MHAKKKALLAVGVLAGLAALTGCTAKPLAAPTAKPAQQQTAQPQTAQPSPQATASTDEAPDSDQSPAQLALTIDGEQADGHAIMEMDELLLPLEQTGEKLGWKVKSEQTEEETQIRRVITMEKDDSRITVSWTVSDNTAKNISWQKDGLLVPVDARLTTVGDVVYVPAAFFEEAMDVRVVKNETNVIVSVPKPDDTPKMAEDSSGEND